MEIRKSEAEPAEPHFLVQSLPTDASLPLTFVSVRRPVAETTLDKQTIYEAPTGHFGLPQALQMVTRLVSIDEYAATSSPSAKALIDAYAMDALARQNDQLLAKGKLNEHHSWGVGVIGQKKDPARTMPFPHSEITYASMPRKDGRIEEIFKGELHFQTTDIPKQLASLLPTNTEELFISVLFSDFLLEGERNAMDVRIAVSSLTNPQHKPAMLAYAHANFQEPLLVDHILRVGNNVPENPWGVEHS